MCKSREQRLITKEYIATHTNLILLFILLYFSDKRLKSSIKPKFLSLSTVVLNSRDRHEKTWRPTFTHLHNMPHNILYPKSRLKCIVPLLNAVKILTMRSVENFKNFEIYHCFV